MILRIAQYYWVNNRTGNSVAQWVQNWQLKTHLFLCLVGVKEYAGISLFTMNSFTWIAFRSWSENRPLKLGEQLLRSNWLIHSSRGFSFSKAQLANHMSSANLAPNRKLVRLSFILQSAVFSIFSSAKRKAKRGALWKVLFNAMNSHPRLGVYWCSENVLDLWSRIFSFDFPLIFLWFFFWFFLWYSMYRKAQFVWSDQIMAYRIFHGTSQDGTQVD